MEDLIGTALGWIGTIGTFSAYVLIWRGWVDPSAKRYSFLNAAGGFMASAGALAYGAWPAVASNLVWGLIGVQGLLVALRRRSTARGAEELAPGPAAPQLPSARDWDPNVTEAAAISLPWLMRRPEADVSDGSAVGPAAAGARSAA